jgi:hypothetical protein
MFFDTVDGNPISAVWAGEPGSERVEVPRARRILGSAVQQPVSN